MAWLFGLNVARFGFCGLGVFDVVLWERRVCSD